MKSLESDIEGDIIGHRMEIFITCSACLARADSNSGEVSANN
jgi:hypothetical protein